jgi:hypothetical protein
MTNVVGGFLITDRMLKMFKRDAGRGTRDAAASGTATPPDVSGNGKR